MPHYRKNHKNHKNKNRNKNNNNHNNNNNNQKQNKNKNDEENSSETTGAGCVGESHQETGQQPTASVVVQSNDSGNSTKSTSTTINTPSETLPTTSTNIVSANSPLNSEKSENGRANAVDTVTPDSATHVERQFVTSVKVPSSPAECAESQSPREMGMVNTKTLKDEDLSRENVPIIAETATPTRPQGKVVIHKIVHEAYRVESPEASVKEDVSQSDQINSELLDTDNTEPHLVSETTAIVQRTSVSPNSFRVLSIETLPIGDASDSGNKPDGSEDDSLPFDCPPKVIATSSSSSPHEDYKLRKAQKRAALETHFLPQFISPRFLDSIKEENNDTSSELIRSADENNYDDELDDDVFIDNEAISKKANAVYPKSQGSFSKKRKTTPLPAVIQEETFPCVVEAKIIEQESIEESCSTWSSGHTAESQDAEVVYINSASSSVSDLLDLDYANDTPIIDLDTDVSELIMLNDAKVQDSCEKIPAGNDGAMPPATTTSANCRIQCGNDTEITNEPITQEFEFIKTNESPSLARSEFVCAAASTSSTDSPSDRQANCNLCPEAIECGQSLVANDSEMSGADKFSNLTKVPSSSSSVKGDLLPSTLFTELHDRRVDDIGDLHKFSSSNIVDNQIQPAANPITTNIQPSNSHPSSPVPSTCSPIARQGSLESQHSDISQNTTHSQCTAINQESPTCCDWTDFDVESSVSGGGRTTAASSTIDSSEADFPDAQPIKKLRQICTEALASTPYGEVVLEELANVATDIGEIGAVRKLQNAATVSQHNHSEMPYPLPTLPQIDGIELSVDDGQGRPKSLTLTQLRSPSPPPIPDLPAKHSETWLGVPTASDPKVLVCLSPSQRNFIGENLNGTNTDSLLDAHKKFVERRGYHEFTNSQLNAMNAETNAERQIIQTAAVMRSKRKSLTPPPVPPPPIPRKNVSNGKHAPNAAAQSVIDSAKKQAADEQKQINDQRLLALVPNSVQLQKHQSSNEIAPRLAKTDSQQKQEQQQQQQQLKSNESQAQGNNIASLEDFREIKTTTSDKVIRDEKTFESSTSTSFAKASNNRSDKTESNQFPTMQGQSLNNEFMKKSFPFSFASFEPMPSFVADDGRQQKTKRYSNVETSTYESKKRIENGHIVYDTIKSNRECFSDGENPSDIFAASVRPTTVTTDSTTADGTSQFNLNTTKSLTTSTAPPAFGEATSNDGRKTMITAAEQNKFETFINSQEHFKNRTSAAATDRIGQNASGPAIGSAGKHNSVSQREMFKDFDELSHQLNMELESTKAAVVGVKGRSEKMSTFYDLSRLSSESKEKFEELKRQRHEHMQELEREIERSRRSRQLKTPTELEAKSSTHKSHFIPIHLEGTASSKVKESRPKLINVPVRLDREFSPAAPASAPVLSGESKTHNIPIQMEFNHKRTAKQAGEDQRQFRRAGSLYNLIENGSSTNHSSADDWNRYANDLGSSENISRPFQREVEICYRGRRPNIRAPRLSVSTNDISDVHNNYISRHSMIDENPQATYVSTTSRRAVIPPSIPPQPAAEWRQRRASLPKEIHEQQLKYIASKEQELQAEFERLEKERRRLLQDMSQSQVAGPPVATKRVAAQKLPTLSEGEVFRQQMAEEWLNKVAEREERRLQKIIKISKINEETMKSERATTERNHSGKTDIGDEFLKRVKERRSKLAMPSDSDWESGAESQPTTRSDDLRNEGGDDATSVKVIEGQTETDLRQLPRHLREFAKITTNHKDQNYEDHKEERSHEVTANSTSSSIKKSSFVKSVKVSRGAPLPLPPPPPPPPASTNNAEGRYAYKSNGYVSEPEPNYDSDYSTVKYRTLDRRRLQSTTAATSSNQGAKRIQDETVYGTMPNPIKSGHGSYRNQPGRIEDYVTGHSSVSEKEKKEWWDEVMDIFNGQLDQAKLSPHYTEGNLSRALLKEQGYASDSNVVFRKKELPQRSPLSPVEQKQVYRSVQAGGEPPLYGFRKPAPEKPKDSDAAPAVPPAPPVKGVSFNSNGSRRESPSRYFESDVNIHYKTPIRYEYKDPIPEEELAMRQAESMQKLYQEERRRKYLQELQDMNSRRHTDNFTPSQKSPIPLNRYDDFPIDLAPKSPNITIYPKTIARALYNFQGQTARELTFKKGDVIFIRRKIDKNWYEGEHNAMIGLLPANYVELLTKDGVRQPPRKPSEGQARAKFNFQAQSGIELSLNKGELVTLTRRVDDNWFEGKIANRKGIFPVSYVEVLTDIGADDYATTKSVIKSYNSTRPSLDTLRTNINNEFNSLTQNGHHPPNGFLRDTKLLHKTDVLHVDTSIEPVAYRALYKYRPQNSDELELHEGDIVLVLEKCDDGWFVGTSQRSGCFGTFPGNYVERV